MRKKVALIIGIVLLCLIYSNPFDTFAQGIGYFGINTPNNASSYLPYQLSVFNPFQINPGNMNNFNGNPFPLINMGQSTFWMGFPSDNNQFMLPPVDADISETLKTSNITSLTHVHSGNDSPTILTGFGGWRPSLPHALCHLAARWHAGADYRGHVLGHDVHVEQRLQRLCECSHERCLSPSYSSCRIAKRTRNRR